MAIGPYRAATCPPPPLREAEGASARRTRAQGDYQRHTQAPCTRSRKNSPVQSQYTSNDRCGIYILEMTS